MSGTGRHQAAAGGPAGAGSAGGSASTRAGSAACGGSAGGRGAAAAGVGGLASLRLARANAAKARAARKSAERVVPPIRSAVSILDRIEFDTLAEADRWLAGRDLENLPIGRVWRTFTGPESVAIFVLWEVPEVRAFYALRANPAARSAMSGTVVRTREVLEPLWPAT